MIAENPGTDHRRNMTKSILKDIKLPTVTSRPVSSVVHTISEYDSRTRDRAVGLQIEGYVIVSADGMLADARNIMPDELKFEGDKRFFSAALDRADLIVHGRNSLRAAAEFAAAQARSF